MAGYPKKGRVTETVPVFEGSRYRMPELFLFQDRISLVVGDKVGKASNLDSVLSAYRGGAVQRGELDLVDFEFTARMHEARRSGKGFDQKKFFKKANECKRRIWALSQSVLKRMVEDRADTDVEKMKLLVEECGGADLDCVLDGNSNLTESFMESFVQKAQKRACILSYVNNLLPKSFRVDCKVHILPEHSILASYEKGAINYFHDPCVIQRPVFSGDELTQHLEGVGLGNLPGIYIRAQRFGEASTALSAIALGILSRDDASKSDVKAALSYLQTAYDLTPTPHCQAQVAAALVKLSRIQNKSERGQTLSHAKQKLKEAMKTDRGDFLPYLCLSAISRIEAGDAANSKAARPQCPVLLEWSAEYLRKSLTARIVVAGEGLGRQLTGFKRRKKRLDLAVEAYGNLRDWGVKYLDLTSVDRAYQGLVASYEVYGRYGRSFEKYDIKELIGDVYINWHMSREIDGVKWLNNGEERVKEIDLIWEALKSYTEAISLFKQVESLEPAKEVTYLLKRASAYLRYQDIESARSDVKEAIKLLGFAAGESIEQALKREKRMLAGFDQVKQYYAYSNVKRRIEAVKSLKEDRPLRELFASELKAFK